MSPRLQRSGRDQESVYGERHRDPRQQGRTVRHLRNGSARCVVWNLKDESGERVPGGVYDISVSDAESLTLVVMSGYSRSIEK